LIHASGHDGKSAPEEPIGLTAFAATDNPGFAPGRSDRYAIVSIGIFAALVGRERNKSFAQIEPQAAMAND
jgi:hypothetical protein